MIKRTRRGEEPDAHENTVLTRNRHGDGWESRSLKHEGKGCGDRHGLVVPVVVGDIKTVRSG